MHSPGAIANRAESIRYNDNKRLSIEHRSNAAFGPEQFETAIDPNAHIYVSLCQKDARRTPHPSVRQEYLQSSGQMNTADDIPKVRQSAIAQLSE